MDDEKHQFLNYLNGLVKQEESLRRKYGIGDNYRALANQFKAILARAQKQLDDQQADVGQKEKSDVLGPHERLVYVHLFNASGKTMTRWANVLSPRNLMEYSVNRPIYGEEAQVKAYMRSRPQTDEHAYLVMKVDKAAVLSEQVLDPLGQPLLKLKEKTLFIDSLVAFVHNGQRYCFIDGQLMLVDAVMGE